MAAASTLSLGNDLKPTDIEREDIIIAVMGPTGSGKSTFIDIATKYHEMNPDATTSNVGHGLQSYTTQIRAVRYHHPSFHAPIVFVDTPGFDDTYRSDADILDMIASWLKETYKRQTLLSGLLYFHRILDPRMGASPLRNLRMFKELCGERALINVMLTTTMWGRMPAGMDEKREKDLHENYWKPMITRGSATARFMDTYESAWEIVTPLAAKERLALLLQQELMVWKLHLGQTKAGKSLYENLQAQLQKQQETSRMLREQKDPNLTDELQRIDTILQDTLRQVKHMKTPLRSRMLSLVRKRPKQESPLL